MKNLTTTLTIIACVLTSMKCVGQISTFDSSAQGWTTIGDAQSLTHFLTGGNPGGYLRAQDASLGQTWYWLAPNNYLGSKISSYGQYFRLDMRTTSVNQNSNNDIRITGNGQSVYFDLTNPVINTWTHYDIFINDTSGWKTDSSGFLVLADYSDIINVLDSVSQLLIRGELSSVPGDQGSLDNVILESNPVFLDELVINYNISVYPNPSNGTFTIALVNSLDAKEHSIIIRNVLSQLVFETKVFEKKIEVKLNNLALSGIYFMEVYDTQNKRIHHNKIVIE